MGGIGSIKKGRQLAALNFKEIQTTWYLQLSNLYLTIVCF